MEVVGDRFRERRAEHRDRRGEHDLRFVAAADGADRFQQRARAVEIDAVAFLEIGFRLARHHAGKVKDHLRPLRDRFFRDTRRGEIGGAGLHVIGKARGPRRRDNVDQCQLFDSAAAERSVDDQPLGELAADHARRAGDQDVHLGFRSIFIRRLEAVDPAQVGEQ